MPIERPRETTPMTRLRAHVWLRLHPCLLLPAPGPRRAELLHPAVDGIESSFSTSSAECVVPLLRRSHLRIFATAADTTRNAASTRQTRTATSRDPRPVSCCSRGLRMRHAIKMNTVTDAPVITGHLRRLAGEADELPSLRRDVRR